jgi:enamine deaminase RidA (YjgF/YER057c/UK114 family)
MLSLSRFPYIDIYTTVTDQTKETLAKIDALLSKAGSSKSNILTAQIWLKDISRDFDGMNAVWNDWIDPQNKPTRATVQAALARPNILVEIQVTAAAATWLG